MRELTELLQTAGHTDFRDARGPMGFTQRQANGKFTRDEADEYIAALQHAMEGSIEESPEGVPDPPPVAPKRKPAPLEKFTDAQLAAELQRRGWVVMEP